MYVSNIQHVQFVECIVNLSREVSGQKPRQATQANFRCSRHCICIERESPHTYLERGFCKLWVRRLEGRSAFCKSVPCLLPQFKLDLISRVPIHLDSVLHNLVSQWLIRMSLRKKELCCVDLTDLFCSFPSIEGEYVPVEGDEVSYKICSIPPKHEKIQAVEVTITHLAPGTKHETWSGTVVDT